MMPDPYATDFYAWTFTPEQLFSGRFPEDLDFL